MNLSAFALAVSVMTSSLPMSPLRPIEPTVILCDGGVVSPITVEEYVARVVAHEVPYTYGEEALKAQAVAARTYLYYCLENNSHPHAAADVCTNVTHCCGYITEDGLDGRYGEGYGAAAFKRIRAAVRATEGEVMVYGGEPILALWHASSSGYTEDCTEVFGGNLPYLAAVATPEFEEAHVVSFTGSEVARLLLAAGYSYNGAMTAKSTFTAAKRCDALTIGNVTIGGTQARKIFGLRSTDFIVWWRRGRLYFKVSGYGHGVGLSQVGANVMAERGATYDEILRHYYTGVDIMGYR